MDIYIMDSEVYYMAQPYDAWLEFAIRHVNATQSSMSSNMKDDYARQLAAQWHYNDALKERAAREKRLEMQRVAEASARFETITAALKAAALKAASEKAAS